MAGCLGIRVELLEIDVGDTASAELYRAIADVVIAVAGGVRSLAALLILLAILKRGSKLYAISEDRGEFLELTQLAKFFSAECPSRPLMALLRSISAGCKNARELAEELGKDRSTVYRQIVELMEMGLVEKMGRCFKASALVRFVEEVCTSV